MHVNKINTSAAISENINNNNGDNIHNNYKNNNILTLSNINNDNNNNKFPNNNNINTSDETKSICDVNDCIYKCNCNCNCSCKCKNYTAIATETPTVSKPFYHSVGGGVVNGLAISTSLFDGKINETENTECVPMGVAMQPRSMECLPAGDEAIERREVFIPGFMHITNDANCYVLAYSVLKALLLSLNRDDVCAVRLVHHRSKDVLNAPPSVPFDVSNDSSFPSLIVRLLSSELVRRIMNARRSFNYLTTADVDHSLLTHDLLATLPSSKIFVN